MRSILIMTLLSIVMVSANAASTMVLCCNLFGEVPKVVAEASETPCHGDMGMTAEDEQSAGAGLEDTAKLCECIQCLQSAHMLTLDTEIKLSKPKLHVQATYFPLKHLPSEIEDPPKFFS